MTLYGPAIVGHLYGASKRDREHEFAVRNLLTAIEQESTAALGYQAAADASVALVNSIMAEIQAEAAGSLTPRRYSDPAANSVRNKTYMAAAKAQLKRLADEAGLSVSFPEYHELILGQHHGEPATAIELRAAKTPAQRK